MYFRSRKKLQGEVSLNDSLDSDADGESLYLMDVVGVEDTMYLEDVYKRQVRGCLQIYGFESIPSLQSSTRL